MNKDLLELLAQDIRRIARDGILPDGDGVNLPTLMWAEEWDRKLSEVNAMKKYFVWCPDQGGTSEDAVAIEAVDSDDAACLWAQREDIVSADYWIVGGDGATVHVLGPDGVTEVYRVTGEQTIVYRASAA